jgi:hypothetical protein
MRVSNKGLSDAVISMASYAGKKGEEREETKKEKSIADSEDPNKPTQQFPTTNPCACAYLDVLRRTLQTSYAVGQEPQYEMQRFRSAGASP